MSYVVLARKWRPQQLGDLVGQEHVSRTLSNAILASRIAHAFLFSGPRGVGKTSAARILAKALCCGAGDGPTVAPCGECRPCVEITEGRSTDVFEIDAASHTGVDNVREIIDGVRYLPSAARFKIYVIDEVHMLSTGAFNALLKTLEEPPAHVKFILATTDVHKVPVTILSRCQRYDFRRIPVARIAERLSSILTRDGIEHDPSSLSLIAREAEGSMRDAQSLLEQVLAYTAGERLDVALVRSALGVVDAALIEGAFACLVERRPGRAIELVGDAHDRGLDLKRFAEALIEEARDLLAVKLVERPGSVVDRPKDELEALAGRASGLDVETLERLFEQLCRVTEDVARASHPRFALEVGLASIAGEPPRIPVDELLSKLDRLESALRGGPAGSGGGAAPPRGSGARSPTRTAAPGPARASGPEVKAAARPADEARDLSDRPAAAEVPVDVRPASGAREFADFVALLQRKRPALSAMLAQVRPLAFVPVEVVLGCETAFDLERLQDPDTRGYLEKLLAEFFGEATRLVAVRPSGDPSASGAPRTLAEREEEARRARAAKKEEEARSRPAVGLLTSELGANVARVHLVEDGG